jgi:hypothetical protein
MSESEELKLEIRKIQMQRRAAKQQHEVHVNQLQSNLVILLSILSKTMENMGRKSRAIYVETLEDVMGPCRLLEEAKLVEISHTIEIYERQLEKMVRQYRSLTDYMVCEINVLETERKEIQQNHAMRYEMLLDDVTHFTNSFACRNKPKEKNAVSVQPIQRRRSSCCTQRRSSIVSYLFPDVNSTEKCDGDDDEEDDISVMSDLSMSVSSVRSSFACKSIGTAVTTSTRHDLEVEEFERFTVVKL